jgi:hypothetical protein
MSTQTPKPAPEQVEEPKKVQEPELKEEPKLTPEDILEQSSPPPSLACARSLFLSLILSPSGLTIICIHVFRE